VAKSLKDRICEGLEDRQGLIVPVIRKLMAEAWDEGGEAAIEREHTYGADAKAAFSNPYRPSNDKEQRNDGSEAVRPR
jgi:hypothetical protein